MNETRAEVIRDVRERLGRTIRHAQDHRVGRTSLCEVCEYPWPCDVERMRRLLALLDLEPVRWHGDPAAEAERRGGER